MEPIADWLNKRGMSEYAQRFAENRIDLSALPDLTDQDLAKLGVLRSDRRKILRLIADFKNSDKAESAVGIAAARPAELSLRDSAELRQVTVMFSDLVGSTALSARMDPEDLREVILAYQNVVARIVHRFGGFVAEYRGDGVLVYFGYPRALEDDAERAVRAGLALIAEVTGFESGAAVQTRVGIATDLVVADLIGSEDMKERSVVGEMANLTAHLQAVAEPNTVVIADSTRKLLGDLFELKDLGFRELKGIAKSVRAWTTLRPSCADDGCELKDIEKPTPKVGIAAAPPAAPRALDSVERRQVTVMFSDLVGSTALSPLIGSEHLRQVISAYHKTVAEIVDRFDGFVAEYRGDGVLVYFGYPRAHEDEAERAVRAGLELIAAMTWLGSRTALQARVGIATGSVVVGDLIGSGDAQQRGIFGETPNLAARLQAIAEPNTVVIADSTRKLLGDLFELENIGSKELKGIDGPVQAWAALRPRPVESRFDALHTTGLTELVGREQELELLLRHWSKARTGKGQVVLVSGEAGIGKSRLTAALLDHLAAEPHTRLRYFCSPQHTESALYPIINQMERAAGLVHDDKPQAKLDKLESVLAQTASSIQDAALFAQMLSLPDDGRFPALELGPQERRHKTLEALIAQVAKLAMQQPVLMIFEDVHWIDPTSLELLGQTIDRTKALPVLLIITFRPDFNAPWVGQSHLTSMALNRLRQPEVDAIIARLVGKKGLPADVIADIAERTDGIPLFVEEMTKAVLEAEGEVGARRAVTAVKSAAFNVPASLHASLTARLDRLGPAKEVAQIGAAIGRTFSHALLASVVRETGTELESGLNRLIQADLLSAQGVPPHTSYLFKHSLVQDAAYGMLLRAPRRALHARIAETLESQFAEIAQSQPELLARHYTEASLIAKASGLWGKAGQRSLERSALVEAAAQLTRALEQIATLPGTAALRREQIDLQVALAHALMHTKGYAAPETKASFNQARLYIEDAEALGEPPEDPLLLFSVLFGFWITNFVAFDGDLVRELAAQFLALAEKQRSTVPLMVGHRLNGVSLMFTGNIAEGRAHFDQAIALYDPAEHRPLVTRFGHDAGVANLTWRSWALWILGYPEAARADIEHALEDAREIGQAATLMFAIRHVIVIHILRGDYAAANTLIQELVALADEKDATLWKTSAELAERGCLSVLTGKASDAIRMINCGSAAAQLTGSTIWSPRANLHLARAHAEVGQFEEAWRCIGETMTVMETTKEKWCEAEVHRTAGEITLLSPEPDAVKAESHFERALGIAREQKAKSWELRAAMSTARLWRDQGKQRQAYDLLASIYGWFTEGFDTLDLKEAKTLLDELARGGLLGSTRL